MDQKRQYKRAGIKCPLCGQPTIGVFKNHCKCLSTQYCPYYEKLDEMEDSKREMISINMELIKINEMKKEKGLKGEL